MLQRTETLLDELNRPITGAKVYVYDFNGDEAVLTIDGTIPLAQPVLSDEFGGYSYYADVGYYTEDIWLGASRRWKQANIAIGNPGADLGLRTDLANGGVPLIGLGNGSTLSDVLRINAAAFGFRANRTAAQNLTALTNAIAAAAGAANPVVIDIPPDSYSMDGIGITTPNIAIDAHGSTFLGTTGQTPFTVSPAATGFKFKNARLKGDTATPLLILNSSGGGVQNIDLVKTGAGDGYMMTTEGGVTDNVYDTITLSGGNGIFIEGERLLFNNIHGVGRAAGGDDFLVLKARNRRTGDIQIGAVCAKNYSNGVAFGGEVGTLGAASAARAGRVENVKIGLIELRDCAYGLFFKPGAVDGGDSSYDWRDGLVRGVKASVKMYDADGTKMRRGLVISAARNAIVEWPDIDFNGEGRFASSADDECWAQVFLPDSTGWTAGGAGGTVRDITLDVKGFDPYAGVDNGVGSAPGNPAAYGVAITKQAAGVGTVERVRIKAKIDGTKADGIAVSVGMNNAVTIDRFIGRNLCVNPTSAAGGIHAESIIYAPGENEIAVVHSSARPIYVAGAGDVIGRRATVDFNAAAGVNQSTFRQFPHDVWLRKASGVPNDTVGASGTVYFSLEVRAVNGLQYDGSALDGNPLTTKDTQAVGTTQFTPFDFPALPTAGATFEDRFLKAGAVVRIIKTNTGGGQSFVGPVDIHFVQTGARI